jgi:hypothetical protein
MTPTLQVYVQNHHRRSAQPVVDALGAIGESAIVMTDETDHYTKRDGSRYRGNFENFLRILQRGLTQDAEWLVSVQDDIAFPPSLFANIRHVLAHAPGAVLVFYVPRNKVFEGAVAAGAHVVETYLNSTALCIAFRKSRLRPIYDFGAQHILPAPPDCSMGEDAFLSRCFSRLQTPARVIVPSFVQHMGLDGHSLFRTANVCGGRRRDSADYDPAFDATTVDWDVAFAQPYRDTPRRLDTFGMVDLPPR